MAQDLVAAVGRPMPDLALPDLDGRLVRLRDYKGRKVLIFVWGSW